MTNEDKGAARVFGALCDPVALRLLLHVVDAGECDSAVGRRLEVPSAAAAAHLDLLADAGLLVRTEPGRYRLSDGPLVERLLATVRQLAARQGG